jgi:hypothetical protein
VLSHPQDWSPLGLDADPAPGDAGLLANTERDFRCMSDQANQVNTGLDTVLRTAENGGFIGRTAQALREEVTDRLKKFISNIALSFDIATDAMARYRSAVETAQGTAAASLRSAQALIADTGGPVPPNDPRLAALRARAQAEHDWLVQEALTLERSLHTAADLVSQPIKVHKGFIDILPTILEWTGVALSFLAVIVGGPLALAAFAVNLAIFVKFAVDYAHGDTNGLGLGLAFLGMLFPTTRRLGLATVLKPIIATTRGAMGALRSTAQAAASAGSAGLASGLRATGGFLVGAGQSALDAAASVKGAMVRGIDSVPGLVETAGGWVKSVWQAGSFAVRSDFWANTWFAEGAAQRIGVYSLVNFGRGVDLAVGTILPMEAAEIGAYGYQAAAHLAFVERGLSFSGATALGLGRTGAEAAHLAALDLAEPRGAGGLVALPQPEMLSAAGLLIPGQVGELAAPNGLVGQVVHTVPGQLPHGVGLLQPRAVVPHLAETLPEARSAAAPGFPGAAMGSGPPPVQEAPPFLSEGRGGAALAERSSGSAAERLHALDEAVGLDRTDTGLVVARGQAPTPFREAARGLDELGSTGLTSPIRGDVDLAHAAPDGMVRSVGDVPTPVVRSVTEAGAYGAWPLPADAAGAPASPFRVSAPVAKAADPNLFPAPAANGAAADLPGVGPVDPGTAPLRTPAGAGAHRELALGLLRGDAAPSPEAAWAVHGPSPGDAVPGPAPGAHYSRARLKGDRPPTTPGTPPVDMAPKGSLNGMPTTAQRIPGRGSAHPGTLATGNDELSLAAPPSAEAKPAAAAAEPEYVPATGLGMLGSRAAHLSPGQGQAPGFPPVGLHEAVTHGAGGDQIAQRLHAWSAGQDARSRPPAHDQRGQAPGHRLTADQLSPGETAGAESAGAGAGHQVPGADADQGRLGTGSWPVDSRVRKVKVAAELPLPRTGGPAAADGVSAGRPGTYLVVDPKPDGGFSVSSHRGLVLPAGRAVVNRDGEPLYEVVDIWGKRGRRTDEFWSVDYTKRTAVRVDSSGAALTGLRYTTATVESSATGELKLVADGVDKGVVLFEREMLDRGRVLHVNTDSSGRARWYEYDPADRTGNSVRSGSRVWTADGAGYQDTLSGRCILGDFASVRVYRETSDGGLVRAERDPDGSWTWQRFNADGKPALSGKRIWNWARSAYVDVYQDPVTGLDAVAQFRTRSPLVSPVYGEHPLASDPITGKTGAAQHLIRAFNQRPREIGIVQELADGSRLHMWRLTSQQQLPAFTWKGLAGGHWYDGFSKNFFDGDARLAVFPFTETAPDGSQTLGVRLMSPYAGNWRDVDKDGWLLRESRILEDGRVLEVGRAADDPKNWAPNPRPTPGQPYELRWQVLHGDADRGLSGTRYVAADGRAWYDVVTDTDGVERLSMRSQGEFAREYLFERPPAAIAPGDNSGVWVQRHLNGDLVARRDHWGGPHGDLYVEAAGAPHRRTWTWKAYAADDGASPSAVPVATGKRLSNRGSLFSPTWDDSFVDLDATGTAIRERNALKTGSAWVDATRQEDGSWVWQRFGPDGREQAAGVREYHGSRDHWTDRIGDVEVRSRRGGRVREYAYTVHEDLSVPLGQRRPMGAVREDAPLLSRAEDHPTVTVDRAAWKEYDIGKVVRDRVAVPGCPGRYRETDRCWGAWREYHNDRLIAQRTVAGRVWQTDVFGRWSTAHPAKLAEFRNLPDVDGVEVGLPGHRSWRLVGREIAYRGARSEFRGYHRLFRDVHVGLWTGSKGGVAQTMSRTEQVSRRLAIDFSESFLISVSTNLVATAAVNHGELTPQDVLRAMVTAGIIGSVSGVSTVLHECTALGKVRLGLGNQDASYPRNFHNISATDSWAGDWAGWENYVRWRGGTYDYGSGLVTGAIGSFVANAVTANVFGIDGHHLTGANALLAGGWGVAATTISGVTTSAARAAWHCTAAGRVFHRGGLSDLAWNWAESLGDRFTWYMLHTMGDGIGPSHAVPPDTPKTPATDAAPPVGGQLGDLLTPPPVTPGSHPGPAIPATGAAPAAGHTERASHSGRSEHAEHTKGVRGPELAKEAGNADGGPYFVAGER